MKTLRDTFNKLQNHRIVRILLALAVILTASAVFALRYRPAFHHANFYAEDGKVFMNTAMHKSPPGAIFSGFDGYLVVGTYLLIELAYGLWGLLGLHFYVLPVIIAIVSCLFLGLTVSLPYLLFRKQLGTLLALVTVLLGAFIALPAFDYAIIGTIGNTKFLFLYWGVMFTLYRCIHSHNVKRVIWSDVVLLIGILTYAPAAALLPFLIWPYRKQFLKLIKTKRIDKSFFTVELISLYALLSISAAYLAVIYLRGIPKIPGYLDTPYQWHATIKIAYRSTWYAWLYPITPMMRDLISIVLIVAFGWFGLQRMEDRFTTILCYWAILIATVGFVANRPGISDYFKLYANSPDQFFFAQTLVFLFASCWLLRNRISKLQPRRQAGFVVVVLLFLWWAAPYGSSFGRSFQSYGALGNAKNDVLTACKQQTGKDITFQIYPVSEWKWTLSRSIACK